MGQIKITVAGSFGQHEKVFSAQHHGHVDAVAEAIKWLVGYLMPKANTNDHKCHDDGVKPNDGWERKA